MLDNKTIYEVIFRSGLVKKESLLAAYKEAEKNNISLEKVLFEKDLISEQYFDQSISNYFQVPLIKLKDLEIKKEILTLIPELTAQKHSVIAFGRDETGLKIATSNPQDKDTLTFIANRIGQKLHIYYAPQHDIAETLSLYRLGIPQTFKELVAIKEGKEVSVEKIVQQLLEFALSNGASDIHIEPHDNDTVISFRIDGILHDVVTLPKNLHEQIVTRVKILADLRTDEHQGAQDGKLQFADPQSPDQRVDVRVSIAPVVEGENVVLRLLSEGGRKFNLTNLGLNDADVAAIDKEVKKSWGMIIMAGPTGSGKTTTLYAILKIINKREVSISTIEDPVEYDIEGVNQIQVNPKTNLTFAEGLRSIVRQDPNVIMVGEIRDDETAGIAINAAMTGHMVLSTIHANDAATTLPRLIDMKIEPYLITTTVKMIVAQRIVRKICPKCIESYEISIEELKKVMPEDIIYKLIQKDQTKVMLVRGKGCKACHETGYDGRTGIFEVLRITPAIGKLVNAKATSSVIMQEAKKEGMKTMLEDGLEKILKGVTTIEEIIRATRE